MQEPLSDRGVVWKATGSFVQASGPTIGLPCLRAVVIPLNKTQPRHGGTYERFDRLSLVGALDWQPNKVPHRDTTTEGLHTATAGASRRTVVKRRVCTGPFRVLLAIEKKTHRDECMHVIPPAKRTGKSSDYLHLLYFAHLRLESKASTDLGKE